MSADGRLLAAGDIAAGLTLWNLRFDRPVPIAPCPLKAITFVAFSPDGQRLAAASRASAEIVLLELDRPSEWIVMRGRSPHLCLAYSRDGRYLAAGEAGNRPAVCLWDLASKKQSLAIDRSPHSVLSVAFSGDGNLLATCADYERGARLWELGTGRLQLVTAGHPMGTNAVASSPDGAILATVGNDGKARLWAVKSGEQRAVLDGRTTRLSQVSFSADGQFLVAATSNDNDLHLWDLTNEIPKSKSGFIGYQSASQSD
jgi:WD40 repeat protein